MRREKAIAAGVGVCVVTGVCYFAVASTTVGGSYGVPASLSVTAGAENCSNSPGPTITLWGEMALGGIDAKLIFRNATNGPHEHEEDVEVSITVLEPGEVITFAKQPPLGGVGGNPYIFLQIFDEDWRAVSDRVLLGRCVQGLDPVDINFLHLTDLAMKVEGSCSNSPGPFITLEGELSMGGLNAILSFQNSTNNPPHRRDEVVDVDFVILDAGDTITFAKQPPLGGVGGNPKIWLQFVDEYGLPISDEIYIGRCNKL